MAAAHSFHYRTPKLVWHTDLQKEKTNIPEEVFIEHEKLITNFCLDMVKQPICDLKATDYLLLTVDSYKVSFERKIFEFVKNYVNKFILRFFEEVILISLRRKGGRVELADGQIFLTIEFDVFTGNFGRYCERNGGRRSSRSVQHGNKWIIWPDLSGVRKSKLHELQ